MSARDTIFQGIRAALAPLEERAAYPDYAPAQAEPQWLAGETDLPALFQQRLTIQGGRFFDSAAACAQWLPPDAAIASRPLHRLRRSPSPFRGGS